MSPWIRWIKIAIIFALCIIIIKRRAFTLINVPSLIWVLDIRFHILALYKNFKLLTDGTLFISIILTILYICTDTDVIFNWHGVLLVATLVMLVRLLSKNWSREGDHENPFSDSYNSLISQRQIICDMKTTFEHDKRLSALLQRLHIASWTEPGDNTYSLHDMLYSDKRQLIRAGSSVEGTCSCRLYKGRNIIVEIDQLVIVTTLPGDAYGILFGPVKTLGWYWISNDVNWSVLAHTNQSLDVKKYDACTGFGLQKVTRNGPAYTFDFGEEVGCSLDFVQAIQINVWPPEGREWFHRRRMWPSSSGIDHIRELPCFLVHKPSSPDPQHADEFYVSFTLAEQYIVERRTEGMKLTYFFFKSIFYNCFNFKECDKCFSSYLAKTTMMWASERVGHEEWVVQKLERNLSFLFSMLLGHLDKRFLPHYFIPELNLLRNLPEALYRTLDARVDRLKLVYRPLEMLPPKYERDNVSVKILVIETSMKKNVF